MDGIRSLTRDLTNLNDVAKELVDTAADSDTTTRDDDINGYMREIDDIISRDFKKLTDYTSNDLSLFIMDFLKENGTDTSDRFKTVEDIFESDSGSIIKQFQTSYSSEILKMEEISMITKEFAELREAIEVFRDTLINADEHTNSISRELLFKNISDMSNQSNIVSRLESLETEYDLPRKIKSHIIPRTLEYGTYYVYVVPYSRIFERYAEKKRDSNNNNVPGNLSVSLESADMSFVDGLIGDDIKLSATDKKSTLASVNAVFEGISVTNDDLTIPVLESMDEVGVLFNMNNSEKSTKQKDSNNVTSDGVADIGGGKLDTDFSNVDGVYMRLIDPRKMIPVKVLGKILGYYYLHEEAIGSSRTPFTSKFRLDLTQGYTKKEEDFMNAISTRIVKSFNKPFLEKNVQFKENIAAALIHNDVYSKDIKFQFIPADHIAPFKVSEDEEGRGVGMLDKSIFYAKLYLSLLYFNMITILSKSNDQRVYYIHSSGIEKNIANKIQNAARQIKSREMNYGDLFNYKSMVNKVGAGRDAYIPVGVGGQQGVTFDILAGQQVELHSELVTMLKTSAINNTGVPSVVMDYVNQADYSRSIVMGNMRFLSRCISTQLELNPQITKLYQMIMTASGKFDEETIVGFSYKLAKPRTLDMTNIVDMINNSGALADFIVNNLSGESSDKDELDNLTKDIAYRQLVKDITSSLGWNKFDEIWEDAVLRAKKEIEVRKSRNAEE